MYWCLILPWIYKFIFVFCMLWWWSITSLVTHETIDLHVSPLQQPFVRKSHINTQCDQKIVWPLDYKIGPFYNLQGSQKRNFSSVIPFSCLLITQTPKKKKFKIFTSSSRRRSSELNLCFGYEHWISVPEKN